MDKITLVILLAVTVEALVEYGKNIGKAFVEHQAKTAVTQLCALVGGVLICWTANADLYAAIGVEFAFPWLGIVLTGVFASRGANFVSDLIGKLTKGQAEI